MPHFAAVPDRNFVKFTFIRVLPEWRRRTAEERAGDKREFAAACADFAQDHLLRAYSLVGTRGDCDLMVRALAPSLDPIHELHVLLNQSGLMRWAEISHSYLAMTKESVYSDEPQPLEPRPGSDARYLIVYPMWKKREWYLLPAEERMRVMKGHIETGLRYTGIEINTAYSYGLDDQEFVVSFNADDPGSSSTSCRSCARRSRAPTPSRRLRSSRVSRHRWSGRWTRWTAVRRFSVAPPPLPCYKSCDGGTAIGPVGGHERRMGRAVHGMSRLPPEAVFRRPEGDPGPVPAL